MSVLMKGRKIEEGKYEEMVFIRLDHPDNKNVDKSKSIEIEERPHRESWERFFFDPDSGDYWREKVRELREDDIKEFKVSSDKEEIQADGEDTALITAEIELKAAGDELEKATLFINDEKATEEKFEDGKVIFEVSAEEAGTLEIQVKTELASDTVYLEAV